jgi:hypothetical protein
LLSHSHNAALGPGSYGRAVLVRSSSGSSGVEVTGCSVKKQRRAYGKGEMVWCDVLIIGI